MMTISDIIEIIVVCALIFFPLGYLARHSLRRIRDTLRLFFAKPRYVKPAGTLRRTEKAGQPKMTQFTQNTAMPSSLWQYWRGLPAGTSIFWLSSACCGRDILTSIRSSIWCLPRFY